MTAQIFIVEDHPIIRRAYTALLQREPDLAVCGFAASGEEALMLIPRQAPDLVLVDLSLPQMNGLTFLDHLYQLQPAVPSLIISSYEHMGAAASKSSTLLPNVKGYIHKTDVPKLLVPTIRSVLKI